jgi:hypothetical protein
LFDGFLNEWRVHFAVVGSWVPFLSSDEFEELVKAAIASNSWAYAGQPVWAVPYMLVLQGGLRTAEASPEVSEIIVT